MIGACGRQRRFDDVVLQQGGREAEQSLCSVAGSGVDRSWAASSTSTRLRLETAGQAPCPRSGTPQGFGQRVPGASPGRHCTLADVWIRPVLVAATAGARLALTTSSAASRQFDLSDVAAS